MKIVNLILHGNFTDGMAYQENCLPYYQSKVYNAEVVIIAGQYKLELGTNKSIIEPVGETICDNGLRLIRIKSTKSKFLRKFAYYPTLLDILEQEKPDYIFAHLVQSLSMLDLKKYKEKHPQVKIFADNHADYINSAHNWMSKYILHKCIWRMVLKSSINSIETLYGVLPARVDFLRQVYKLPIHKTDLLMMGAEDDKIQADKSLEYRSIIRQKLSIKENDFVFITGGKIDLKKNIGLLVDSLNELELSHVKLIIFGKPDLEMNDYLNVIREIPYIRYIGWITPDEMYQYFHAADMVVFPGTHSVLWEQAVGTGLPGIFRHWDGIEHIDKEGNIEFINGESKEELKKILEKVSCNMDIYNNMRTRAEQVKDDFLYSSIARRSLIGNN